MLSIYDNVEGVGADIISGLMNMLNEYNDIVKVFRTASKMHRQFTKLLVRIRILKNQSCKNQNYSASTTPEIAALIVGDFGISDHRWDIIVEHRHEGLKGISDLHPLFMPLQYPVLFPYGKDCFYLNIPYEESPVREKLERKYLTMREYYAYLIQQKNIEDNILLR